MLRRLTCLCKGYQRRGSKLSQRDRIQLLLNDPEFADDIVAQVLALTKHKAIAA
jgi:hypothetical protein